MNFANSRRGKLPLLVTWVLTHMCFRIVPNGCNTIYPLTDNFNQTFQNNPPNAAITAVSNDSDQFGGPTVVILSNASMLADGSVSYDITLSQEQDNELSLGPFFRTGSVVQFTHCSIFIDSAAVTGFSVVDDKEEENQPVLVSDLNLNCETRMLSDFRNGEFFSSKNHPNYAYTWNFSPPNGDHYTCQGFCKACVGGYYDNACSSDGEWSCKIYDASLEFESCKFEESIPYHFFDKIVPGVSFTLDEGLKCSSTDSQNDCNPYMIIECESDAYRGVLYFVSHIGHYELSIIDEGTYTVDVPFFYDDYYDNNDCCAITHCR